MNDIINIIKGIHPGKFIQREVNKRKLTLGGLAEGTGMPYIMMEKIISGQCDLTTEQALKLDRALGYDEGFFTMLQTLHNIKRMKEAELLSLHAEAPHVRKSLFWDTDFNKINWGKYKDAVLKRVSERGSQAEIEEIARYYNLTGE